MMKSRFIRPGLAAAGLVLAGLVLAGCVHVPADGGAGSARGLLESRSEVAAATLAQPPGDSREFVARLLAAPIGVNEAVQLALLGNPRVRQLNAELGFSGSEIYDATRLANPTLSFLRLSTDAATGGAQTTWGIAQSFTELLFLSYRSRLGAANQAQAEQRFAHAVLELEAEVREAFYTHAGAALAQSMRSASSRSTRLSAELGERFHEAGNISVLQLSREQALASEAVIGEHLVVAHAEAARGRLLTLMGLRSDDSRPQFITALATPVLLDADAEALEQQAREQRLDLAALRLERSNGEAQWAHMRRWRWLAGLRLSAEHEREPDGEVRKGPGASIELPVFNSGRGAVLRAEAGSASAAARLQAMELALANDIATQLTVLESRRLIAEEYRMRLIPLKEEIVEQSQREQNFMLIGAFELLAARREELDTYGKYIDAVRDYWIERTRLARLVGGPLPGDETDAQPITLPESNDAHATRGGAQ